MGLRDQVLALPPPPARLVLDLGCGDGRAARAHAGLLVEALREPAVPGTAIRRAGRRRWQRLPPLLRLRALRA